VADALNGHLDDLGLLDASVTGGYVVRRGRSQRVAAGLHESAEVGQ